MMIFIAPFFVFAQNSDINYVPLSPIEGTTAGFCDPNQTPARRALNPNCEVNSLTRYLPQLFTLSIQIAAVLAVIMITVGGIEYIGSESLGTKADGKKKITNAIIGLLLIVGSWVILNTINPRLLNFNLAVTNPPPPRPSGGIGALPPIGFIPPTGPSLPPGSVPPVATPPGTVPPISCAPPQNRLSAYYNTYPPLSAWPTDSAEKAALNPRITFNQTSNCPRVCDTGCTTLYGVSSSAISGLNWLATNCPAGCNIVVTGGTEFWAHATHGPGRSAVDLRIGGSVLDNFIRRGVPGNTVNNCFNGMESWVLNGVTYVDENRTGYPRHWHVCY